MGIVIKQSIKGTLWAYLGVLIGFFTTSYIYPNYLTPAIVGLFGLLLSYSILLGQIFLFGLPAVTNRLFPYFRDSKNKHNGFLFIALIFHIIGIAVFILLYFFLSPKLVEANLEKSPLFAQYVYLIVPLTIANMIFIFLDTYNKVLYNTVYTFFLQEVLQRVLILAVALLYVFNFIDLNLLIILYSTAVIIKTIMLFLNLLRRGEINLKPDLAFLTKPLKKEIKDVALFGWIGGLGSIIVFNFDKIIINEMIDLKNTGVYTIAFFFGSLVVKPSKPLLKISGTLIADAWKNNDLKQIKDIYYKSSLNQLIIGGFLFLGLWANIDSILVILGKDYIEAKWVIFFIGLGYLIDMSSGVNGMIISFSKYYRVSLLFIVVLIVMAVIQMFFLIPLWGIAGAAIAIASALFFNNLIRFVFLHRKFKLQPFNYHFLIIIALYVSIYFISTLYSFQNIILDIVYKSGIIVIISFLAFGFIYPVSEDIKHIIDKAFSRFKRIK